MHFNSKIILLVAFLLSYCQLQSQSTSNYDGAIHQFKNPITLLYGLMDSLNTVILPAKYESLQSISKKERLYCFRDNGKLGIIDYKGKVIVKPTYKYNKNFLLEDRCIFQDFNGRFGVTNYAGDIIIPFHYMDVSSIFNRTYTFKKDNNLVGLINDKNEIILEPKYNSIRERKKVGYTVCLDKKCGFVSVEGKIILPYEYESIVLTIEGGLKTKKDGKYGYYDLVNNKQVLEHEYEDIYSIGKNVMKISQNSLNGLYDFSNQKIILPIEYDRLYTFRENHVYIEKENKMGLFSLTSKNITIPIIYDDLSSQEEYLIFTNNRQYGLIDTSNNIIIKPQKLDIIDYHNDIALLRAPLKSEYNLLRNNKLEFSTNLTLTEVLASKYWTKDDTKKRWSYSYSSETIDGITHFSYGGKKYQLENVKHVSSSMANLRNSLLILTSNGKYGVYRDTSRIVNHIYDELIVSQSNDYEKKIRGHFIVAVDGKYGLINDKKEVIIPLENESIKFEGFGWLIKNKSKYGFYSYADNDYSIPLKYSNAEVFNCRFICEIDGRFGVVDGNDKIILPFEYDSIELLKTGWHSIILAKKTAGIETYSESWNRISNKSYSKVEQLSGDTISVEFDGVTTQYKIQDFIDLQYN